MLADGYLNFNTKIDTKGFNQGLGSVNKGLDTVKNSLSGIAKLVATVFSVKVLIDFGKKAIELASDIEEVQNVVDVSFGDMAYQMEAFADSAIKMYGISKLAAKQTGSTFMAMASGMGLANEAAADMSLQLTALSADMASFYNKTQEQTATALKSVFTGETEVLKQYGIVMTEANLQNFAYSQGIKKNISTMTQAEKVQLRYNFVMQQTALAQGDFARTSSSWANQIKLIKMKFDEFASSIGIILKNIILPGVRAINQLLSYLISGATRLVQVFSKLFGWETDTASSTKKVEQNTSDTLDNEKKTTAEKKKQNKEAQRLLGTYDKLDVIQQDTADSADEASSALGDLLGGTNGGYDIKGTLDLDTSKADSKIDAIVEKVKKMFENSNFSELGNKLRDKIVEGLGKVDFAAITEKSNAITTALATFINGLFDKDESGKYSLTQSIGKFIGDAFNSAIQTISTFIGEVDWSDIGGSIIAFFEGIDWGETIGSASNLLGNLATALMDLFAGAFDELSKWMLGDDEGKNSLSDSIADMIVNAVTGINWDNLFTSSVNLIDALINALINAFVSFGSIPYSIFVSISDLIAQSMGYDDFNSMMDSFGESIKNWFTVTLPEKIKSGWSSAQQRFDEFKITISAKLEDWKQKVRDKWSEIDAWWNGTSGKNGENAKPGKKLELKLKFQSFKKWLSEQWAKITTWWNGSNGAGNKSSRKAELRLKLQSFKEWLKEKWASITSYWNGSKGKSGQNEKSGNKLTLKLALQPFTSWLKDKWDEIKKKWEEKTHNLMATLSLNFSDRVSSAIKSVIESIVNFLNNAIGKINKVLPQKYEISPIEMPTWRAPKLATGMVVPANYGEFAAILGDNRKAPEIVSPIPDMQKAMAEVLERYGSTSKAPIVLQLGRKVIAQATWDEGEKRYKQTGRY